MLSTCMVMLMKHRLYTVHEYMSAHMCTCMCTCVALYAYMYELMNCIMNNWDVMTAYFLFSRTILVCKKIHSCIKMLTTGAKKEPKHLHTCTQQVTKGLPSKNTS